MSFKPKSHKGLGDEERMTRLRGFASDGVWPSNAGNPQSEEVACSLSEATSVLVSCVCSEAYEKGETRLIVIYEMMYCFGLKNAQSNHGDRPPFLECLRPPIVAFMLPR
ncbi:hypothetical protein GOODEAATRI_033723 [Goodea atripinnis]|uniref:Uncharacterized protein n=1 Tax=Goodea atripinnis TaxID=208336 RepID=A0ABV0N8P1_9TELE